MTPHQIVFTKNPNKKGLHMVRYFDASPEAVWKAWTEPELLDLWWAPKPWQAKTKEMDLRNGGHWLYAMIGPDGEQMWSKAEFEAVQPLESFSGTDYFCDEHGERNNELPGSYWDVQFKQSGSGTEVQVTITFDTEADMVKHLEMGFEEGFTSAQGNLDQLLATTKNGQ